MGIKGELIPTGESPGIEGRVSTPTGIAGHLGGGRFDVGLGSPTDRTSGFVWADNPAAPGHRARVANPLYGTDGGVPGGAQSGMNRVREGFRTGRIQQGVPVLDESAAREMAQRPYGDATAHAMGIKYLRSGRSYEEGYNRIAGHVFDVPQPAVGSTEFQDRLNALIGQASGDRALNAMGLPMSGAQKRRQQQTASAALERIAAPALDLQAKLAEAGPGERRGALNLDPLKAYQLAMARKDPERAMDWIFGPKKPPANKPKIVKVPRFTQDQIGGAQKVGEDVYRYDEATGGLVTLTQSGSAERPPDIDVEKLWQKYSANRPGASREAFDRGLRSYLASRNWVRVAL